MTTITAKPLTETKSYARTEGMTDAQYIALLEEQVANQQAQIEKLEDDLSEMEAGTIRSVETLEDWYTDLSIALPEGYENECPFFDFAKKYNQLTTHFTLVVEHVANERDEQQDIIDKLKATIKILSN